MRILFIAVSTFALAPVYATCKDVLTSTPPTVHWEADPYALSGQGFRQFARKVMLNFRQPHMDHLEGKPLDVDKIEEARKAIFCLQTVENKKVFLCVSYGQVGINETMWRYSIFSEGFSKVPGGAAVSLDHPARLYLKEFIGGFNIPGLAIRNFHQKVPEGQLSLQERVFKDQIYGKIAKLGESDSDFYLLGLPLSGFTALNFYETASHEILHGQLRMDPGYAAVVKDFWENEVSLSDQKIFTDAIADVYQTTDVQVVRDEFQAYMLQLHADTGSYGSAKRYGVDFAAKYRNALRGRLLERGIKFIEIQ